ncbi:Protein trichome birefringence [Rhynchospora pubera]|uniref:Protein trichome birefringence n=1 Tax=Rhynchospora pubera TaxID=906938 RepID=A0AAV8G167_9POAL|nr:Protein trichome birefringence [Rhynchospora pubera]
MPTSKFKFSHLPPYVKIMKIRSQFNSLVVLLFGFLLFLAASLRVRNSNWKTITEKIVSGENSGECDFFSGQWVYDDMSYPLYRERQCRFMSDQSACEKFGRSDLVYQKWRWQPDGCNLPRFDGARLLEKLRGKRMVFVGDSLNRNQWVSMVCLLDTSTDGSNKAMETHGNLMSFKLKDFNASVDFYWSPLLVESNSDHPVLHRVPDRIVRAHSIEKHAKHWTEADILVFNTYLWWRRRNMKVLWGSFKEDDGVYKEIDSIRGYELAIKAWSDWLEFHINRTKTELFFMSMSPTHSSGDEWGTESGHNCYNDTLPILQDGYWGEGSDPRYMHVVETTIQELKEKGLHVKFLNITQLSEYRKDGHPSVFRKQWDPLTEEQLKNPSSYADCIHWCLPGVPDVWNQILFAHIFS